MKQVLFMIILLSVSGCRQFSDPVPADLIPEDRMVQVLADTHVADAVVDQKSGVQVTDVPLTNALYTRIYKNNNISAERFRTSYRYYEAHPVIMDRIYVQVITELSKREALLNKK